MDRYLIVAQTSSEAVLNELVLELEQIDILSIVRYYASSISTSLNLPNYTLLVAESCYEKAACKVNSLIVKNSGNLNSNINL